mgnify:CR=1 FL=1
MKEYTGYVNPFIGTGGHGHTHPGAMLPHGMIQPGPDTRIDGWDSCSGYYYEDSTINGFAHTRLSGTGCADFGDFLLMPTVGEQKVEYLGKESQQRPFASAFSHRNEYAEPGYYSVFLDTYGVKAELTATERAAMHRYTFPESKESGFILDMDYNIQQQTNQVMEVEAVNDTVLCGYKRSAYWAWQQDLYFYAVFSKPFTHTLYTDTIEEGGQQIPVCKMLLRFDTAEDEQVMVRFSISSVDGEGARQNLLAELPDWDFDKVRADARKTWNDCLSKIEVKTEDPDQLAIFYTAMYHAFLSPNLFTDVDGRYLGMDLKVHTTDKEDPVYTTFSIWDTFRALHPLLTIIDPHTNESYIRSLLKKQREGGVFPKWDCAANYTGTMIGYHAASIITDAYVKGYRDFDVREAYQACLRTAEYDTTGIVGPKWPVITRMRWAIFLATSKTNRWQRHWNMHTMIGVYPYWQIVWEMWKQEINMLVLPGHISLTSTPKPVLCGGGTVRGNGVLRSILVRLPIAVTIIAKVRLGSGLGLCLTMCPVWLA